MGEIKISQRDYIPEIRRSKPTNRTPKFIIKAVIEAQNKWTAEQKEFAKRYYNIR